MNTRSSSLTRRAAIRGQQAKEDATRVGTAVLDALSGPRDTPEDAQGREIVVDARSSDRLTPSPANLAAADDLKEKSLPKTVEPIALTSGSSQSVPRETGRHAIDSDPVGRDPGPVTFSGDPADQISAIRPSVKPEVGQESTPADALPPHVDSRSPSAQLDEHFIATVVERTLGLLAPALTQLTDTLSAQLQSHADTQSSKFAELRGELHDKAEVLNKASIESAEFLSAEIGVVRDLTLRHPLHATSAGRTSSLLPSESPVDLTMVTARESPPADVPESPSSVAPGHSASESDDSSRGVVPGEGGDSVADSRGPGASGEGDSRKTSSTDFSILSTSAKNDSSLRPGDATNDNSSLEGEGLPILVDAHKGSGESPDGNGDDLSKEVSRISGGEQSARRGLGPPSDGGSGDDSSISSESSSNSSDSSHSSYAEAAKMGSKSAKRTSGGSFGVATQGVQASQQFLVQQQGLVTNTSISHLDEKRGKDAGQNVQWVTTVAAFSPVLNTSTPMTLVDKGLHSRLFTLHRLGRQCLNSEIGFVSADSAVHATAPQIGIATFCLTNGIRSSDKWQDTVERLCDCLFKRLRFGALEDGRGPHRNGVNEDHLEVFETAIINLREHILQLQEFAEMFRNNFRPERKGKPYESRRRVSAKDFNDIFLRKFLAHFHQQLKSRCVNFRRQLSFLPGFDVGEKQDSLAHVCSNLELASVELARYLSLKQRFVHVHMVTGAHAHEPRATSEHAGIGSSRSFRRDSPRREDRAAIPPPRFQSAIPPSRFRQPSEATRRRGRGRGRGQLAHASSQPPIAMARSTSPSPRGDSRVAFAGAIESDSRVACFDCGRRGVRINDGHACPNHGSPNAEGNRARREYLERTGRSPSGSSQGRPARPARAIPVGPISAVASTTPDDDAAVFREIRECRDHLRTHEEGAGVSPAPPDAVDEGPSVGRKQYAEQKFYLNPRQETYNLVGTVHPSQSPLHDCFAKVALDSQANRGNWISQALVSQAGMAVTSYTGGSFQSPLSPGETWTPSHVAHFALSLPLSNIGGCIHLYRFEVEALVSPSMHSFADIIIGQDDMISHSLITRQLRPVDDDEAVAHLGQGATDSFPTSYQYEDRFNDDVDALTPPVAAAIGRNEAQSEAHKLFHENFLNSLSDKLRQNFVELFADAIRDGIVTDRLNSKPIDSKPISASFLPGKKGTWEGLPERNQGMPDHKKEFLRTKLQTLLEQGIIESRPDLPASPVHVAVQQVTRDANGKVTRKYKLVVACVEANNLIVGQAGNIPLMKTEVSKMSGFSYYFESDALSAYFQMRADDDLCDLFAFSTPFGTFRFRNRTPLGVKTAPAFFNNVMCELFAMEKFVSFYFDDIRAGANSPEELLGHCQRILAICKEKNLLLSKKKTIVGAPSTIYCGFKCSADGYGLTNEQKEPLSSIPFPYNKKRLMSWFGMLTYLVDHLDPKGVMEVRQAFRPLLKKDAPDEIVETPELRAAFEKGRSLLHESINLHPPDPTAPVYVEADACDWGVGAILFQWDERQKKRKVIRMKARSFQGAELNWSTFDKEMFAMFFAVTSHADICLGNKVIVRTDHRNLLSGMFKSEYPRIKRMAEALRPYDLEIQWTAGVKMKVADPMSRNVEDMREQRESQPVAAFIATLTRVAEAIPEAIKDAFRSVHNTLVSGHLGINKTFDKLRRYLSTKRLKIPANLKSMVVALIEQCEVCALQRGAMKADGRALRPADLTSHFLYRDPPPFSSITIDFATPSCKGAGGLDKIFVAICNFSRFVVLLPAADETASTAAMNLMFIGGAYRMPNEIRSDRGPAFVSETLQEFCKRYDASHVLTLAHTPQTHGTVERAIKEVWRHLQAIMATAVHVAKSEWPTFLCACMSLMNNQDHSSTGFAPASLVFGTQAVESADSFLHISAPEERQTQWNEMENLRLLDKSLPSLWRASIDFQDLKAIDAWRKAYETARKFVPGDLVLIKNHRQTNGKMELAYRGPFKVLDPHVESPDDHFGDDPAEYELGDIYLLDNMLQGGSPIQVHIRNIIPCPANVNVERMGNAADREASVSQCLSHHGDPRHTGSLFFNLLFDGDDVSTPVLWRHCNKVKVVHDYCNQQSKAHPRDAPVWKGLCNFVGMIAPPEGRGRRAPRRNESEDYLY